MTLVKATKTGISKYRSDFLVSLLCFGLLSGFLSVYAELMPRCGDCWCAFDGELDECPSDQSGISDVFLESEYRVYETFTLTNPDAPYLKLRTPGGEECYPFANTLGIANRYPKSALPQCDIPESTEETVCAYLFEEGTPCEGRNYQILNYESTAGAEAAGAVVTHQGACGVCSNAFDLWARMDSILRFEIDTVVCGAIYLLNTNEGSRLGELQDCAKDSGLSDECALLWSHYGAAIVASCSDVCSPDGTVGNNGPPPLCALNTCAACPSAWSENFAQMAGRSLERSGITDGTAKECSRYSRIEHTPCIGATTNANETTQESTSPPGSGTQTNTFEAARWVVLFAALVGCLT